MPPRFSPEDVTVVFLLGGPGSGKGTQSVFLVREYDFIHLSAGDLLRAEQNRPGSQVGDLIRSYIREGKIVPMEITVSLLADKMGEHLSRLHRQEGTSAREGRTSHKAKPRFLIDGFPRKLDQAVFFEETVCKSAFTIFLHCPEEEMEKRLLERGKTSGRDDDNAESIRKRFRTFVELTTPVIEAFKERSKEGQDSVVTVDATGSVEEVSARIRAKLAERGMSS